MNDIKFKNDRHKHYFYAFLAILGYKYDCFHIPLAYLISLDEVCFSHFSNLFDIKEDCIKLEGLNSSWQTGTSRKTTRLIFNLWNGHVADPIEFGDKPSLYSVGEIFCCNYAPYYFEAVKLRYPEYAQ